MSALLLGILGDEIEDPSPACLVARVGIGIREFVVLEVQTGLAWTCGLEGHSDAGMGLGVGNEIGDPGEGQA